MKSLNKDQIESIQQILHCLMAFLEINPAIIIDSRTIISLKTYLNHYLPNHTISKQ